MYWAVLGMKWAALGGPGAAMGLYWVVLGMNWTVLGGTGGVEWAVPTSAHHCLQPISARDQGLRGSAQSQRHLFCLPITPIMPCGPIEPHWSLDYNPHHAPCSTESPGIRPSHMSNKCPPDPPGSLSAPSASTRDPPKVSPYSLNAPNPTDALITQFGA